MWSSVESGGGSRAAPCARAKHSATLLGGHVYVLGGRGAGGCVPLRDFWRYSLATGVWERLECRGEPPPSLQEHTATAHEGKLYIFGGEAGALSNETPLWIYDTESQLWRKLPGQSTYLSSARRREARERGGAGSGAGPRGRRGHSAHALKDCLLIYGGYKDLRGSTNELWAFHYETESWQAVRTGSAGPARHRHAAALHAGALYVHAGQCDLRDCSDLWHYDTMSRAWSAVRGAGRAPGARSGHAAARAGSHLYIFGGEAQGHACNDMWRFHFASQSWERIVPTLRWPSPRVDSCALLVSRAPAGGPAAPPAAPPAQPAALLARLSSFQLRRAARCSYTALADKDSTESLVRQEAALAKSHSAYVIDERLPADGIESPSGSPLARDPCSVPDLADLALPTAKAAKLVYLDSEDEEEPAATVAMPKSASVRFTREAATAEEEDAELSTSDYASAERVNRPALGFSNPHYLGPDVRALGAALTPDSGVAAGDMELQTLGPRRARPAGDMELQTLGPRRTRPAGDMELQTLGPRRARPAAQLHLLLVGGREGSHAALLHAPLSMWAYRLL